MSLLDDAGTDVTVILGDTTRGFSRPCTVVSPGGAEATVPGFMIDVARTLDLETGVMLSGRSIAVTFAVTALADAGFAIPVVSADTSLPPWVVALADGRRFAVVESTPDRTLGAGGTVTLLLSVIRP